MKSILFLFILFLVTHPLQTYSENYNSEIDLSVNPHNVLFDLSNVKPGDRATRILSVANNGSKDFNYIISNKFLSGSEKFYEELLLRIEDSDGVLYEGKLHEYSQLEARPLLSKASEELLFYIEIPYELGNEFQGLTSEFQFKIYVEGTMGGIIPVNGPKLPTTATQMFNTLLVGLVLVASGISLYFFRRRKNATNDTKST